MQLGLYHHPFQDASRVVSTDSLVSQVASVLSHLREVFTDIAKFSISIAAKRDLF